VYEYVPKPPVADQLVEPLVKSEFVINCVGSKGSGVVVGVGVGVSLNKDQTTFPFRCALVAEEPLKYMLLLFSNKLMLIDYNI
jgi:hypothetical protein